MMLYKCIIIIIIRPQCSL